MKLKWLPSSFFLVAAFAIAGFSLIEPAAADDAAHLAQGYTYLGSGKYSPALLEFNLALADAEMQGDQPGQLAEIYGASGYALYLLHRLKPPEQVDEPDQKPPPLNFAEPRLKRALDLSRQAKNPALEARIKAYLGLVHAKLSLDKGLDAENAEKDKRPGDQKIYVDRKEEYRQQAKAEFKESHDLANNNRDLALAYATQLHLARLEDDPSQRFAMLKQVHSNLPDVKDDVSRVDLLLNIMDQLESMHREGSALSLTTEFLQFGFGVAQPGIILAAKTGMLRAQSQGEGFLASCLEWDQNRKEAIQQTVLAIRYSVQADAPDLIMAWQSKLARLLTLEGQEEKAINAYDEAMLYVDMIRNDIPLVNADGKSSYTETLEPIYRGMADLLLRKAARMPRQEDQQELLHKAVYSLEKLKQSELEDYFNARCSLEASSDDGDAPKQTPVKILSAFSVLGGMENLRNALSKATGNTAILYPVILNDRLELLLVHEQGNGKGSIIVQKTVKDAPKESVDSVAQELNTRFDEDEAKTGDWKTSSNKLYEWIIKPLQSDLESVGIDRIVYIPDGKLKLAPISAFYDGHSFVAEHYAVVINNGLQFGVSIRGQKALGETLLAGLSIPDGPSKRQIPAEFQDGAVQKADDYNLGCDFATQTSSAVEPTQEQTSASVMHQRGTVEYDQQLVKGLALPCVENEITSLEGELDSKPLKNKNFTYSNLEKELQTGDYEFVHIASHGHFAHTAKDSYIMTYDQLLHVDKMEKLIQVKKDEKKRQLDLVTFSACETATGDDQASLGFTGIAIKANVHNALGALWSVDDEATYQFMNKFYKALKEKNGDKLAALKQAQIGMIGDKTLDHPFFWAAFILVGSW